MYSGVQARSSTIHCAVYISFLLGTCSFTVHQHFSNTTNICFLSAWKLNSSDRPNVQLRRRVYPGKKIGAEGIGWCFIAPFQFTMVFKRYKHKLIKLINNLILRKVLNLLTFTPKYRVLLMGTPTPTLVCPWLVHWFSSSRKSLCLSAAVKGKKKHKQTFITLAPPANLLADQGELIGHKLLGLPECRSALPAFFLQVYHFVWLTVTYLKS